MRGQQARKLEMVSTTSIGELVRYPRPTVEKVREHTYAFVNRLEREDVITDDEARQWKENLEQDLESE